MCFGNNKVVVLVFSSLDRRVVALFVSGGFSFLLLFVFFALPAPYVIESPGPTYNVLAKVQGRPLIEVVGRETYPTTGELNLVTVSMAGVPGLNSLNAVNVVAAWLNSQQVVVPSVFLYPPQITGQEVEEANRLQMVSSQNNAVAAALKFLDIPYSLSFTVEDFSESLAAGEVFEVGDVLVSVAGEKFFDLAEFRQMLAAAGVGSVVNVTVLRDGVEVVVSIKVGENDLGEPSLGLLLSAGYVFPFEVNILLDNVGGPSAGMMFALGIIDMLSEDDLVQGQNIAGTGTISVNGEVGSIGGIVQKMIGAKANGSDWFLSPVSNCDEVVGNIPAGLRVFKVGTLGEAYEVVKRIGANVDLDSLPVCS